MSPANYRLLPQRDLPTPTLDHIQHITSSRPNPLVGNNAAFPAFETWKTVQFIVLGDSTSDTGRRFNAPASFDFEDIGPYPWTRLFEDPDSDVSISPTNAYHRRTVLVGVLLPLRKRLLIKRVTIVGRTTQYHPPALSMQDRGIRISRRASDKPVTPA